MSFRFATCDRASALSFLKKLYPSYTVEDTDESVSDLLDLVEADEIRITDPDFHQGSVVPGKNFTSESTSKARKALMDAGLMHRATS